MRGFNTSHVTLYRQRTRSAVFQIMKFQYISCYSLSPTPKGCDECPCSFNTSHVTLYPPPDGRKTRRKKVSIHLMLLFIQYRSNPSGHQQVFQYISCYSLSVDFTIEKNYRPGFNTSHVTLYQQWQQAGASWTHVSIHLMLLFIVLQERTDGKDEAFQYISCYSLSTHASSLNCWSSVSIHLMLLFILPADSTITQEQMFQYISCYSLSLYFTAFLTPNIFIIPQNTMHCKIFTRRLDNSLFWD